MENFQIYVSNLAFLNEDNNKVYIELGYTVNGCKIYFNEHEGVIKDNKQLKKLKMVILDELYLKVYEIYKPVNELALIYLNSKETETYNNFFKAYEEFTIWLKELLKLRP